MYTITCFGDATLTCFGHMRAYICELLFQHTPSEKHLKDLITFEKAIHRKICRIYVVRLSTGLTILSASCALKFKQVCFILNQALTQTSSRTIMITRHIFRNIFGFNAVSPMENQSI
jgi:hypothetical protein